jgi:cell division septation protein DedD
MAQPMVTRSQRRIERKQVVLIVILILAVAGVSFFVGVLFGQRGGSLPGFASGIETPKLPVMAIVVPPPLPPPVPAVTEDIPEKLTFYDTLPKGSQAPLGSGINLPPVQKKPTIEPQQKEVVKPASLPSKPKPKTADAPVASTDGAFVVQIASFRAREDAGKMANHLESHKLSTFVEPADLGEKGVWYRVLAGPYASRESADQAAGLLQEKERLSVLVRKR